MNKPLCKKPLEYIKEFNWSATKVEIGGMNEWMNE